MKTKKASAGTLAERNKRQKTSYLRATTMSTENLKEHIGELLFCLELPMGQNLKWMGWEILENMLRRYVDLRISGNNL